MTVFMLSPAIPDLGIPRGYPCSAIVAPRTECGATPASLYLRHCGVLDHRRRIWLCPIHATMTASGNATCRECVARGGIVIAKIERLSMPVRT